MDIITYVIDKNIYVNLTNKCSNNCNFCVRNYSKGVEGYNLWLEKEPTAKEIIDNLKELDVKKYEEIVFCGFGEPMYKWSVICEVADYVHSQGGKTRINTNGQAKLILKRDITNEIGKYIDIVNVSLNATNANKYQEVCRSEFGEDAYLAMLNFAASCVLNCKETILSVVDCVGEEEIKKAQLIADDMGAKLRVRTMIN